jgi:hypothetical protein
MPGPIDECLMDIKPDVDLVSSKGIVYVYTTAFLTEQRDLIRDIETVARSIQGVKDVKVSVKPRDIVE